MTDFNEQSNVLNNDQVVFNISDVAKIVGVVPATIRNWEKAGLIVSKRKGNNYRVYNFHDIELLKKINDYSSQKNMSISMIKQLLVKDMTVQIPECKKYYKELYHTKLKKYREKTGCTLEDVSNAVGISPSYLCRIENGKAGVSFEILDKLAAFYGESTIRFFDIKNEEKRELVRKGTGKNLMTGLDGVCKQSLIDSNESIFESMRITANPGCGDHKSHSHNSGEEFIYVLFGKLKVTLDDSKEFIIQEGDSIHFKSTRTHRWHNPGKKKAEILWVHSFL